MTPKFLLQPGTLLCIPISDIHLLILLLHIAYTIIISDFTAPKPNWFSVKTFFLPKISTQQMETSFWLFRPRTLRSSIFSLINLSAIFADFIFRDQLILLHLLQPLWPKLKSVFAAIIVVASWTVFPLSPPPFSWLLFLLF